MDTFNSNDPGALALDLLCRGAAQELLMRITTDWPKEPLQNPDTTIVA
jgi:hypothetical protein